MTKNFILTALFKFLLGLCLGIVVTNGIIISLLYFKYGKDEVLSYLHIENEIEEEIPQVPSHIATQGDGRITGTLSTGENVTINLKNCELTVFKFKTGIPVVTNSIFNSKSIINKAGNYRFKNGAAVVASVSLNTKEDILHILTLSGKYYALDLRVFNCMDVWRNAETAEYSRSLNSYEVIGSCFINQNYFYERNGINCRSREKLVTRNFFS